MTNAEMTRRIGNLPLDVVSQGLRMISQGYGARGMSLELPVTLKQANAIFHLADLNARHVKWLANA